jgi:hypothetical protein
VCFCRRCKDEFAKHLKKYQPDLPSIDPIVFAVSGGHKLLNEAWFTFKNRLVIDWIEDFKRALRANAKKLGREPPLVELCCIPTGFDYQPIAASVDRISPMLYAYYGSRPEPTVRSIGNDTYDFYNRIGRQAGKLVPTIAPGNYPEVSATGSNVRVPNNEAVFPRVGMKYQVLEAVAGGAAGFNLYYWNALDGMGFKYLAEAVNMIAPVEDLLVEGIVEPIQVATAGARVVRIAHSRGTILFVSEYSFDKVEVIVPNLTKAKAQVVDLATRTVVATLEAPPYDFKITLDTDRARLFYVGDPAKLKNN